MIDLPKTNDFLLLLCASSRITSWLFVDIKAHTCLKFIKQVYWFFLEYFPSLYFWPGRRGLEYDVGIH